jgi:hypothetical protein
MRDAILNGSVGTESTASATTFAVSLQDAYVDIPLWRELCHYRNRRLAWVKLHTGLLHDENYLRLTGCQRAVLHGIWLVYARSDGRVRARTSILTRELGLRVSSATLYALADASFIAFRS